jgi:tetratricopeptide (TPR) repeat protein
MGAVYKAHDLEVNRLVAIKVIRRELASDPIILQRFKQELVLARKVTHPNVVRIYDLGAVAGLRFISMEYIDGRELSDILRERKKLNPKEAAEIILQVCRGLEAAHAQGVIHRDLKPQNIMVAETGRVAVMDFGIAHSAELSAPVGGLSATQRDGLTQFGSLIGTPRYMSPEQAHNRPIDARSDIYAIGIIFYELLTGLNPFQAKDVKELLRTRGTDRTPAVTDVDPAFPKRLSQIVSKCLEGSLDLRYGSTSELIGDLELWLGIRSPKQGHWINRWVALAFSLALAALLVTAFFLQDLLAPRVKTAHPPVTTLISDFKNMTGKPALDGVVEPMLQVAVEGASFINSFNRGQALKVAHEIQPGTDAVDERVARLIALREGIGVVIGGGIARQGSGFRLFANGTNANGKTLFKESADFPGQNDLPRAVDKIGLRIRRDLGDVKPGSQTAAAETFTSGSLASAQKYATAQQLQWEGKRPEAISAYREAIALDPNMSRAYAGLAAAFANEGEQQQALQYYKLALAHIDQESDREKYRTRGGYYLLVRDFQKAAEQFQQLVKAYPADTAGFENLALAEFYGRNMKTAVEIARKAVQLYPQNLLYRNNLALYEMYAGDFESAIKESESIIKENPSKEKAYLCLGLSQIQRGSPDEAIATYNRLANLSAWGASEAALALGDLAIYQGRFTDAIHVLQAGVTSDKAQKNEGRTAVKLVALAAAELLAKQRASALGSANEAVSATDEGSVLYGAAEVYLGAGDIQRATALSKKLSGRFEPEPQSLALLIQGETQRRQGELHAAVTSFEQAQKIVDTWLGRYDLGRAYLEAKLYPDAQNELDVCLKRRGEASAVFLDDNPTARYVPPVYYFSGLAKSGLNSSSAAEDFKAFLKIKQQSAPDPMVSDAKRRLQAQ